MAERRLAAIMIADVVGFSLLVENDEASALQQVRETLSLVIEPLVREYMGRIFKTTGDGVLVEFGSVVDAVNCAVAIQKRLAAEQSRTRLRIGINLGDIVVEGGDLLGDGVNVAARIEQLCPVGGVLVSGTAFDHLKGKFHLPIEFDGTHQVKNISEPVRVYSVQLEGVGKVGKASIARLSRRRWALAVMALILVSAGWWLLRPSETSATKPSVAVLPFDNLGGDEATGRLAKGLTEDIITDLARLPELEVVARNSTQKYKGGVDVRTVGKELDVRFVLAGSIQRSGEQVRLSAQLIDAVNGNHVWSERWDRPAAELFKVQSEIADQVANRLGGGAGLVQTVGREEAKRKRPENLTAYELYLLGTEAIEQINPTDNAKAIELLERAVKIDPGFARAWIELSHAHALSIQFGADAGQSKQAAMAAAERALLLDPQDAEAHAAMGSRLAEHGEFARAEAEYEVAMNLSPGSAEILTFYTGWASSFGKPERGAEIVDRVIRLNPNYPMWQNGPFAYAYFMAGRFADAARLLERIPPDSTNMFRLGFHASSYAALGRTDDAKRIVERALSKFPNFTIEEYVSDPGWNEEEKATLAKWMQVAGFPLCAKAEVKAKLATRYPLPGCD
jgi:TolB-like protein/class 3 adenylate cyclase/Tfp pilus assembly protein PilF